MTDYAVHFYVEDGFLVRGTQDPVIALGWAVAEGDQFELKYWAAEMGRRDNSGDEPDPEQIAALADLCHELVRTARPGLFRIRPASGADREFEGYAWWTVHTKKRGRGTFEGVEFLF